MKKIKIIIADGQRLIRDCISNYLNADEQFIVLAETGNGRDAAVLYKKLLPDIMIIDTKLEGQDCKSLIKEIFDFNAKAKIICLSSKTESSVAKEMFQSGVMGFISKYATGMELILSVNEVFFGNRYICTEIKSDFITHLLNTDIKEEKYQSLTRRELDIVSLINKGCSSKEIACLLSLSVKTIEVHRYNIFKKLNIKKATSLVNYKRYSISA